MNLVKVPVHQSGPLTLTCARCQKRASQGRDRALYADLDGVPFKSYYCQSCADALQGNSKWRLS